MRMLKALLVVLPLFFSSGCGAHAADWLRVAAISGSAAANATLASLDRERSSALARCAEDDPCIERVNHAFAKADTAATAVALATDTMRAVVALGDGASDEEVRAAFDALLDSTMAFDRALAALRGAP